MDSQTTGDKGHIGSPSIIISSGAFAAEPIDAVYALAAVGARVRQALVDVGLAVLPREPWDALAGVPGYSMLVR